MKKQMQIPVRQSSARNRMTYSLKKFRNTLFTQRVKLKRHGTIGFFISSSVEESFKTRTNKFNFRPLRIESITELF